MDRLQYQQKLAGSVVAPNDFTVSDETYFSGNGRLVRVRQPWARERPDLVRSLQALAYTPFAIVIRDDMASPPRTVALVGLDEEAAAVLPAELARMGASEMIALVRRREAHVIVLEGG